MAPPVERGKRGESPPSYVKRQLIHRRHAFRHLAVDYALQDFPLTVFAHELVAILTGAGQAEAARWQPRRPNSSVLYGDEQRPSGYGSGLVAVQLYVNVRKD